MSQTVWSFFLHYARVGIGAGLFLLATRFLTLSEIGLFATAYAPIRLAQGMHKAGIAEVCVIGQAEAKRLNALFGLSLASGLLISVVLSLSTLILSGPLAKCLLALCPIPTILGLSAVSEGLLRKSLALRALALRTAAAQSIAALLALILLIQNAGVWALIAFAVVNVIVTTTVSIILAGWWPSQVPRWRHIEAVLPKVTQITIRDLCGSALIPCAQIAITTAFGLSLSGAFQIATRLVALVDTLTLAPLRFIALPQLSQLVGTNQFGTSLRNRLIACTGLGVSIWTAVACFTSGILSLIAGSDKAASAAPMLQALIPIGLIAALSMPINQALTALGHTDLVLRRNLLALMLGLSCAGPTLTTTPVVTAAALSLGGLMAFAWYIRRAMPLLGLVITRPALP